MPVYEPGDIVTATVKKAFAYRAFVELPGREPSALQATVPSEEYFWADEMSKDYREVFKAGATLKLKVLSCKETQKKTNMVLSRRLAMDENGFPRDPWVRIHDTCSVGQTVSVKIARVVGDYAFGEIREAVKATINIRELREYINAEYRTKHELRDETYNHFELNEMAYAGDSIRGVVESILPESRIVRVDVIARLRGLDSELRSVERERPEVVVRSYLDHDATPVASCTSVLSGSRLRSVFIADDDVEFCNSVKEILERAGISVTALTDIHEIDRFIEQESISHIDVFITDLSFGDDRTAGLKICEAIRLAYPQAMVVLCTAYDVDSLFVEIEKAGICDVLYKPFKIEEFDQFLRHVDPATRHAIVPKKVVVPVRRGLGEDLKQELEERLSELVSETSAVAGAIFSFNPMNEEVELVAYCNKSLVKRFEHHKKNMHKSPIRDLLYRGERFEGSESSPHKQPGKYRYFTKLIEFDCLIGKQIPLNHELGYCFFVFFRGRRDVDELDIARANCATADFLNILMRKNYSEWAEERQHFYLEGKLLDEYGHELSTKSTALGFYSKSIKDSISTLSGGQGLQGITKTADELRKLSERIVELGEKLSGLSRKLDDRDVNIESLLREMVDFALFTTTSKNIEVQESFCGNIPPVVIGNLDLQQVLLNVLVNAIQQIVESIRGKGLIEVSTRFVPGNALPIEIRIRDTGTGIHRKDFDKIFRPLYTTRRGGHGMGLAISHNIMDAIGGTIRVEESQVYEGTTFLIALPKRADY